MAAGANESDRDAARRVRRDARYLMVAWATGWVPLVAVLGVSLLVDPVAVEEGRVMLTPRCTSQRWFGVCPTCGLTRAFVWMSHGEPERAMSHHRAVVLFYPLSWAAMVLTGMVGAARRGFVGRERRDVRG